LRFSGRGNRVHACLGAGALFFAAAPAGAATLQSVLEDAQAIALDTGASLALFLQRMLAGDMIAIKAAAFGASALIGFAGLWLLVLRGPRDEAILALPPPSPDVPEMRGRRRRSMRLLDAVSVARTQYEIARAERQRAEGV